MGPRYAVYYAPHAEDVLWHFGSAVIGYDAATGSDPSARDAVFATPAWRRLTEEPRRYGFHATLKAPFHLREGSCEDDLLRAVEAFASGRVAIRVPRLRVQTLGSFLALVPDPEAPKFDGLAGECVRAFERFRAPLAPADRDRRLAGSLSDRQIRYLDAWGYPFVFEEFRFHMTLSGPLPPERRDSDRAALARLYADLPPGLSVDAVTIFRQRERADRFRVVARFPFGG